MLGFTESTVFFCSKQLSSVKDIIYDAEEKKRILCRQMHPNQTLILVCTTKFKSAPVFKVSSFSSKCKIPFLFQAVLGSKELRV